MADPVETVTVTGTASPSTTLSGMGFTLSQFKARINDNSILRTSLAAVQFTNPVGNYDREISFYCTKTSLPDVALATADVRRHGYGPIERMPFRPLFSDNQFSFIVDGQGKTLQYLMSWLNVVTPFQGYSALGDSGSSGSPYELAYKIDFATDIVIYVFNEVRNTVLKYTLRDAFPREIRSVQMNWAETDQLMQVDAVFAYTDFTMSQVDSLNIGGGFSILSQSISDVVNTVRNTVGAVDNVISDINNILRF